MSYQIIKQPNGKYCVFSSVIDNVIHYDMTAEEIIEERIKEYRERITEEVKKEIEKVEARVFKPSRYINDYADMLNHIKGIYGEKEIAELKVLLEDHPIKQLIKKTGSRDRIIFILQRCTKNVHNIDKMTDDELVALWVERWPKSLEIK
jgi:hypothetical protein